MEMPSKKARRLSQLFKFEGVALLVPSLHQVLVLCPNTITTNMQTSNVRELALKSKGSTGPFSLTSLTALITVFYF